MGDKRRDSEEISSRAVLNSLSTNAESEQSRRTVLGKISTQIIAVVAFLISFPTGTADEGEPSTNEVREMMENRREILSLLVDEGVIELDGSAPLSDQNVKQLVSENANSIQLVKRKVDAKSLQYVTIRIPTGDGGLTIGFSRKTDSVFVDTPDKVNDESLQATYMDEYTDEMATADSDCPEPVGGCRLSDCDGCNNVWCTTCSCVTVFHQCGKAMYICDCCKAHPWCGGAGCSNPYPGNC
ncbi:hypothetical protein [Halorussus litoreus]|uniref:hypothetical protein n=1 Tax=Halorussus litoreus TaxID=1710536 RepID=UPI0013008B97|nr:hypothetical protein [Halorussus litoreus]